MTVHTGYSEAGIPIKAVLFDMDGVLLDSEPLHVKINSEIYRELGIVVDDTMVSEFVGRTSNDRWTRIIDRFHLKNTVEELNDWQWTALIAALQDSGLRPSEGLDVLLAFLKENHIRATIGSASKGTFVEAVIDYLQLRSDMEGSTTGDEVIHCKPSPDIFLLAAKKLGVNPSQCLVIEDSSAGVSAGKAAGMYVVGYDNPTSPGQDLSKADKTVTNLAAVCKILSELNA